MARNMGWCHEFGPQIDENCEHPMTAHADRCECTVCGTVCTGRFAGCGSVWAHGPRDVAVEAAARVLADEHGCRGRTAGFHVRGKRLRRAGTGSALRRAGAGGPGVRNAGRHRPLCRGAARGAEPPRRRSDRGHDESDRGGAREGVSRATASQFAARSRPHRTSCGDLRRRPSRSRHAGGVQQDRGRSDR